MLAKVFNMLRTVMERRFFIVKSHKMLNLFTLNINNKEVAKDFERHYAQKFSRTFWLRTILLTIAIVSQIYDYAKGTGPLFPLV